MPPSKHLRHEDGLLDGRSSRGWESFRGQSRLFGAINSPDLHSIDRHRCLATSCSTLCRRCTILWASMSLFSVQTLSHQSMRRVKRSVLKRASLSERPLREGKYLIHSTMEGPSRHLAQLRLEVWSAHSVQTDQNRTYAQINQKTALRLRTMVTAAFKFCSSAALGELQPLRRSSV